MALRDVLVVYPESGSYGDGDDAPLTLTIVNTGGVDDELTSVSSPAAADVELVGRVSLPARSGLQVDHSRGVDRDRVVRAADHLGAGGHAVRAVRHRVGRAVRAIGAAGESPSSECLGVAVDDALGDRGRARGRRRDEHRAHRAHHGPADRQQRSGHVRVRQGRRDHHPRADRRARTSRARPRAPSSRPGSAVFVGGRP